MWLGIELHGIIVQPAHHRIFALRQFSERRILKGNPALAHGAIHVHDGMTGHAPEAILRLGGIHDFADMPFLHLAGEDQRMIVAAAAPE